MTRRPLPIFAATLALAAAAFQVRAQEPQRPALREDLRAAGEHLTAHPHPYTMSEEVVRTRLQKQGIELRDIRELDRNKFEAQVIRNGQPTKVEINRLNGAIRDAQ